MPTTQRTHLARLSAAGLFCVQLTWGHVESFGAHYFSSISRLPNDGATLELNAEAPPVRFEPYFDLFMVEKSENLRLWEPAALLLKTNSNPSALRFSVSASPAPAEFFRTPTNRLITILPIPSGPYAVGVRHLFLTDPSRSNRYQVRTNSSFMATLWYPAARRAGALPGRHIDEKLSLDAAVWPARSDTNLVYYFFAHALPAADLLADRAPYPVIIFSHGAPGFRQADTETTEALASHGYVVAAVDHIDVAGTQFPDGRYYRGSLAGNAIQVPSRLADIRFLLDELERLNANDPHISGKLDLQKIALYGHSYGGGTVAEMCRIDSRCKAAVLLDANLSFATELRQQGLPKPFACINGTVSPGFSGWRTDTEALFALSTTNAYVFQVSGADHFTFNDSAWGYPTPTSRYAATVVTACVLSFCDKYLRNHPGEHLIDTADTRFAIIVNYQRK